MAALLIWARPRSRAEERRRRRENERHKVPYKDRVGDTAWSAWFVGLVAAAGAVASFILAISAVVR
jgi:hypothetical protein